MFEVGSMVRNHDLGLLPAIVLLLCSPLRSTRACFHEVCVKVTAPVVPMSDSVCVTLK